MNPKRDTSSSRRLPQNLATQMHGVCLQRSSKLASSLAFPGIAFHILTRKFCQNVPPASAGSLPASVDTPALQVLRAFQRQSTKRRDRKLACMEERKRGFIPGVLHDRTYGHNEGGKDVLISVKKRPFLIFLEKTGRSQAICTYVLLEVYKETKSKILAFKERALPRKLSVDHNGSIMNVGFVKAPYGAKLTLSAPVMFLGEEECLGFKEGGLLKQYIRYVTYVCPADLLPPQIEVDISNLRIGDKVFFHDIKADVDLCQPKDPSCPVCEIVKSEADLLGNGHELSGRHIKASKKRRVAHRTSKCQ